MIVERLRVAIWVIGDNGWGFFANGYLPRHGDDFAEILYITRLLLRPREQGDMRFEFFRRQAIGPFPVKKVA
ncbi:hypothetical protein D3C81_1291470 [compost metagenome]